MPYLRHRSVRLSKGDSTICYPENWSAGIARAFAWQNEQDFLKELARNDIAAVAAHFLAKLNAVHPFRESNGRPHDIVDCSHDPIVGVAGEAHHAGALHRIAVTAYLLPGPQTLICKSLI